MLTTRVRKRGHRGRTAAIALAMATFLGVSTHVVSRCVRILQSPPVAWRTRWGGIDRYQPAPDYRAARTIFPYSVVPGGVQNVGELEASVAKDPLVAEHYRDISLLRLRAMRLNTAVDVYASFRMAKSIYWTRHTIHVPKGELILSDGANMIRARCGNRLTFVPPTHAWLTPPMQDRARPPSRVPPPIEPPELVFDYGLPSVYHLPVLPPPPERAAVPLSAMLHIWPPPATPPIWCCEVGGFPGEWVPTFPSQRGPLRPQIPGTPEPGTLLLFGGGLIGVAWTFGGKVTP
jgi:hypothetical protein